MRIVHTCLRYPPATGGVEQYVEDIVEGTRSVEQRRDVRVLTSKLRTHGPISDLTPEQLLDDPPYVQRLHHATTPFLSYPRLQALSYYLGHHQPDIVHGYSYWYQPADVAAKYAKKRHIPFIFHPMYYENDVRHKLNWRIYSQLIGKDTFATADVVGVISPFERSLIEKAGHTVRRFELLPPGIDTAQFTQATDNPFTVKGITGPIILSVGRVSAGKGLDQALDAVATLLKELPDLQYVVIGEDFGAESELKRKTAELGIESHVHFWGNVSDDALSAAYQHANLLLHPSHYEAFGIVLAEAQAAGLPVVARNVAAIPYVVRDKQAGLLYSSPDELVGHIRTLLGNTVLAKNLGEAGKKYVRDTFSKEALIKKVISLYAELCSS